MRTRHLSRLLIVAILLISTAPLYAQRQQQDVAKVGPEFLMLVNILEHLDLNSPDGREIALIIQSLNQSCPD
jgi:hypothetical protein